MKRALDRDVIGVHRRGHWVEVSVLFYQGGKLISITPFSFQTDLPEDGQPGIRDVFSGSELNSLKGEPYNTW